MPINFPSDQWIKELKEKLNASPAYAEAAKTWEGDIMFVVTAVPNAPDAYLYVDLWHGECRDARAVAGPQEKSAEFVISAPLPVWRKVVEGRLDPIRGLVSRQLKLQGNMMKVMKAPKAAVELVNCTTQIDTAWPG
ncbi:MAG: SCP2 sterol-binding domain-containing protein [Chloroflexi bacterium]|nr:SCP2 sterol-binding domain-containing protein [Chloroflexota bacterium]MCI0575699.1 SCP2 sterol-binding domain-containing protein [Chloroflexota bacterium]MCI0648041.1 SCP2 sterol-binding domain-containing protein [Chloroflexota bacterium]MCI0726473.1 SCP2 sterol-binding domain-containing protein [Chloroflexota bacterium]